MAGAFPPLSFQKGGQRGRTYLFSKGVGTGTFWGCDFCPKDIFPHVAKLAQKVICATLPAIFLPQRSRLFFGVTSKKGLHVFFCKPWTLFFEVKQRWVPFFPDFQGFCPDFQQIKTFAGALAPPAPPSPTTLLLIAVS